MSRKRVLWFERVQALPTPLRLTAVIGLALVALAAAFLPGALSAAQLALLLFATVLISALALGLAAGFASATLGFGLMLWRAVDTTAIDGWALSFQAALDAFLWFVLAKLAALLVAARQSVVRQLSETRRQAEAEARRQELLLAEMSHRMSNDLSLLSSMLQMQAAADPAAADALHVAAGRVFVLGRVHGRLSPGAEPRAVVDSRFFLEGLVADLRAGVDDMRPLALTVAAEAHALPLARAGDIGLVVNELITNALKYAFPGGREGVVRVSFRREEDIYELVVADNGIGAPPGQAAQDDGGGLGSQILRGLAVQLGGRLDVVRGEVGGTQCRLRFRVSHPGLEQAATSAVIAEPSAEQGPGHISLGYNRDRRSRK